MRHQSSFIELSSKNSGTSNNIKIGHIGPSVQNKAVCIYLLWLQVFKRFPCVTLKFWSLFKYYFLPFEHPVSNRKSKVQILLLLMLKQNCKRSMYSSCFSRFQPWRLNYEDNVKDSLRPFLPEKQVIKNWLDRIQGLSKVILLLIKYSLYKKCGSVFVSFSEEMCVVYVWLVHSHCNKCVVILASRNTKSQSISAVSVQSSSYQQIQFIIIRLLLQQTVKRNNLTPTTWIRFCTYDTCWVQHCSSVGFACI